MQRRSPLTTVSLCVGFVLLLLASLISFATAQTCVQPPSGLASWWPGDGHPSDIIDGNDGTLRGDATFAPGKVGHGFSFGSTDHDAVLIRNASNLQLQTFTIEAWIKRNRTDMAGFGVSQEALIFGYGFGGYGLGLEADGRVFLTRVGIDNVTANALRVTDTNFHHVSVTKSSSTVKFYVDGVEESAPAYDPGFSFTTDVAIGNRGDVFAPSFLPDTFMGIIDEVTLYNRALSAAEIASIFNAGSAGKCTPEAFAAFTASATMALHPLLNDDIFKLSGTFRLGSDSDGIHPLREAVSIRLGTFSTTIPAGSFIQGKRGLFTFHGVINGVHLTARIRNVGKGSFRLRARGTGAELAGTTLPVAMEITIGDDTGSATLATVTAETTHSSKTQDATESEEAQ